MLNFKLTEHQLKLKTTWAIARESSEQKLNFVVKVGDQNNHGMGECAISPRYGQTPELIRHQFEKFASQKISFNDLKDLAQLDDLELAKPLRFAIESALIHLWSKEAKKKTWQFLNLDRPSSIQSSFSIPIMDITEVRPYLMNNPYPIYKLKIGGGQSLNLIKEVLSHSNSLLRLDANEGFVKVDELLAMLKEIDLSRVEFIEQPFHSDNKKAYQELYPIAPCPIMADEAFIDEKDLDFIEKSFHMVNIKLMKTGSYLKTIDLAKKLQSMNKKLMIGCMIETSLGINSAMNLASLFDYYDLDGSLLIKNDPFSFIQNDKGKLSFT